MSKTLQQRRDEWWSEHPEHVHQFVWNPATDNKHCSCGAWIHRLGNTIHEPWEAKP